MDDAFGVIGLGRIVDEHGDPVLDARPVFEDGEYRARRATPGPDGTWSIMGLAPGPYSFKLSVDGYVPHEETVDVTNERGWRHDVVLRQGLEIPVRFEDAEGNPLDYSWGSLARYLSVVATVERPGTRLANVRGRIAGRYGAGSFASRSESSGMGELDSRYDGVLKVNATPPLWVSFACRNVVIETRSLAGDEDELVFVVDGQSLGAVRGEVRARILDPEGQLVTDQVSLEHPSGGISVSPEVDGGELVFRDVPPGWMELVVSVTNQGNEYLQRSVLVPSNDSLDVGTIHLTPKRELRVRTVDAAGDPVVVSVRATRMGLVAGPSDLNPRVSMKTDTRGEVVVRHLGVGRVLVRAGGYDGLAFAAQIVDTSKVQELELNLQPGVEVVLIGKDRPDESYQVEDASGTPLVGSRGVRGRLQLSLSPGTYRFVRTLDGREVDAHSFEVGRERQVVQWEN